MHEKVLMVIMRVMYFFIFMSHPGYYNLLFLNNTHGFFCGIREIVLSAVKLELLVFVVQLLGLFWLNDTRLFHFVAFYYPYWLSVNCVLLVSAGVLVREIRRGSIKRWSSYVDRLLMITFFAHAFIPSVRQVYSFLGFQ